MSSHILSEISQTCDRLLVIDEGELVAQGTEDELAKGSGSAVDVEISGAADKAKAALGAVEGVRGVEVVTSGGGVTQLRMQAAAELRPASSCARWSAPTSTCCASTAPRRSSSPSSCKLTQTRSA